MQDATPIKRRIAPSVPLKLELADDNGATFVRNFRLSFDFNALARIEEKTGLRMLGIGVWTQLSAKVVGAMLWAAILANHPEYDTREADGERTDDGLEAISSYVDLSNAEQVTSALWEAYLRNLPKEKSEALRKAKAEMESGATVPNEEAPATPPATVPDGSSSGPSLVTTSESLKANSAG
jgi:hypothetical protein